MAAPILLSPPLAALVSAWAQPLYAAAATAGFAFLFGLGRKDATLAALGAAIGWAVYILAGALSDTASGALFAASVAVGLWSEAVALLRRRPATVYMIAGVIPLVPGGGMYYTMLASNEGNSWKAVELGLQTFSAAFAIAIGMAVASAAARLLEPGLRRRRKGNQLPRL